MKSEAQAGTWQGKKTVTRKVRLTESPRAVASMTVVDFVFFVLTIAGRYASMSDLILRRSLSSV